jgi:two-component system cell cycle sensor histidine kinase/response regulator CckA
VATSPDPPTHKATEATAVNSGHEVLLNELMALRRSEAALRDFIETSTIGLHWVGADGTILWVNQAELDLLGYAREEYVGRNIAEFHADESVTNDMLWRLSRGETLRDCPARLRHCDGSIRHVLVNSSVLFEDGKFVHARCFTHDVTALKQEQEANLLLAAIVDSCDDAIISEELTGRITSWNRGAERIFGYTAQETIGQPVTILMPEDRQEEEVQIFARLQRGAPVDHFETVRRRKDGKLLNISLTLSPIRDWQGRIIGGSKIARDITEGKRAEARLRESEARLRFAQQAAGIGTFDWNIEKGENTWMPELEAMYGLPPGDFPGTQAAWEDLVHPDDRAWAVQLVTKSFETGTPARGEWRVIWPDGSVHWLSGRWQVFKNSVGKPVRMTGVNIDITDRQRVKQALLQSEELFRLATKATNDAIWDIDLKTGNVSWNETYTTLYGRPPDTSDSWQWWIDRIHPEDRERTSSGLRTAISGSETTWTCEYRFQRINGDWAYLYDRAYIARDTSGSAWRVIGAMQDLTDRKQAEARLRESEERFRSTADAAPIIMWFGDTEKRVTFVNKQAALFTGIPAEKLTARGWAQVIHPDDLETVRNVHYEAVDRHVGYQFEYRARRADGEYRHMLSTASPRYEGREYAGHVGTLIDITDLKLRQQEDLTRRKWESIGGLAGGIAHDFNNLLGGVLAQAELALEELASGSSPHGELMAIRDVALRGSEIVRQLMIYAGKETVAVERVDVSQIVREMLELLKLSVSKHAVIEADLGRDLPSVRASAAQLRQIVMNLVTNASDAIGNRDGVIRVSTRCLKVGQDSGVIPAVLADDDYVQLEVSDTGHGMSLEMQGNVFDPFFTTKSAGHGLGLAVVQGIVRTIGGSIHLTSEPDKATTFQIMLPCADTMAGATNDPVA